MEKMKALIGVVIDVAILAAFIVSSANYILLGVTAYNTTLKQEIVKILPWFNIWYFFLVMFLFVVVMMLLVYWIIYPSYYANRNKQEYENQNLLRKDLEEIKEKLENLCNTTNPK